MKAKLTVKQRVDLQSILPPRGDFVTIKMIRVLREDLSFTEEELEKLQFKCRTDGNVEWNAEAAEKCIKEITIPEAIITTSKEILERANTAKQITDAHLDFYEMFMELPTPKQE